MCHSVVASNCFQKSWEFVRKMIKFHTLLLVFLAVFVISVTCDDKTKVEEPLEKPNTEQEPKDVPTKPAHDSGTGDTEREADSESGDDSKYKLGSLCNYCSYCKFCKLCDKDCPCKTSKKKPNCHLCKYCKYCSLCSICDIACTPGGIVDVVSSAIYSSLPTFSKKEKEEVDKDIEKARDFIKEYL